jgi:hypothetical protein
VNKEEARMTALLKRTTWVLALLAVASLACPVTQAADAAARGLLDSVVSTLAGGNAGHGFTDAKQIPLQFVFSGGGGLARDTNGNLYYTENGRILRQDTAGVVTAIAGAQATTGFRGENEPASRATFTNPTILTTDPNNNLYVLDVGNNRIRMISAATGNISTVVGNGVNLGNVIGDVGRLGVDSRLNSGNIVGLAVNAAGDIFFADAGRDVIYKVAGADPKVLSLVAGNGNAGTTASGLPALTNPLNNIVGLALLSNGDLVYTETNCVRQVKITTDGTNAVIAGLVNGATPPSPIFGFPVFPDDPTRLALQANTGVGVVGTPRQVAVDGNSIIFWDNTIQRFRVFTIGGVIATVFGENSIASGGLGFRGNNSPAVTTTNATTDDDPLAQPVGGGLVAAANVVTFVDFSNNLVRQFTIGGNVNTIAGAFSPWRFSNTGDFLRSFVISDNAAVLATGASLDTPNQLARDTTGNIYFDALDFFSARKIYKYDPVALTVVPVAGPVYVNGFPINPGDTGPAVAANLAGLGAQHAVLADGSVVFADTIPAGASSHTVRKISAAGVLTTLAGIANLAGGLDPNGDPGIAGGTSRVNKAATSVLLNTPEGVVVDATGNIYIADRANNAIVRVDALGVLTVVNTGALSVPPTYLAIDGNTLYSAQRNGLVIDAVDLTTGAVTAAFFTIPGAGQIRGIAVGNNGDAAAVTKGLYVATTQGEIHLVELPTPTAGVTAIVATGLGNIGGLHVNLNVATFTTPGNDRIRRVSNLLNVTGLVVSGGPNAAPTILAGEYFNLIGNGGPALNTGFTFTTYTPLTVLATGAILVGDDGVRQYRTVTLGTAPASTAVVTAGTGADGGGLTGENGPANSATIGVVGGITIGPDGTLYFSDQSLDTIRHLTAVGNVETFAGIPGRQGYSGTSLDRLATIMNNPAGLAFNAAGELQFNERGNHIVRKVQTDGLVVLVAGAPTELGYSGDGLPAAQAKFNQPAGCAFDANGDYFIADSQNAVIRVISNAGITDTIAGNQHGHNVTNEEAAAMEAELGNVLGVTLDTGGKLYSVASSSPNTVIRTSSGVCRGVVGVANATGFNGDGLAGVSTILNAPEGVLFDATLGIVFTDSMNSRVRRVTNLAELTNTPPEAVIVSTPTHLSQAPFKVRLDGSNSIDADGDIVNFVWDFGDGTTGTGAVVDHTYAQTGSYTVTLTVTDSQAQSNSIKATIFAALPIVRSNTTGKGAFKVAFGPKASNKDSFALAMKNVAGLTNQNGKTARIYIGTYFIDTIVLGKGIKPTSKNVKLLIDPDPKKLTVALSVKGVSLLTTMNELGVLNENTIAPGKTALIPVVVVVGANELVIGDNFLFLYKSKYNSGASGKFAQ